MGLFDKKFCDVCGQKIGLFGNNKLTDGNICDDCRRKLSPWFTGRKKSTLDAIKEQLAYREANRAKLNEFEVSRTLGDNSSILIDEKHQWLVVSKTSGNWRDANPDIISFLDLTGCDTDIDEHSRELKKKDAEGKDVSYVPARYEYSYDFDLIIHVNNPYFDEMRLEFVDDKVVEERVKSVGVVHHGSGYLAAERELEAAKEVIEGLRTAARDAKTEAETPKAAVVCPFCGASTIPDAFGRCEYCGGAVVSK